MHYTHTHTTHAHARTHARTHTHTHTHTNTQVDFAALQTDLERINTILVKVQELQAASQEVPPNVPLIQTKAAEIDAEAREAQGAIERLQETARLVSESQGDIVKVVGLSEEIQRQAATLQPLMEPVQEIFQCAQGALERFNWTAVDAVSGTSDDGGRNEWQRIFVRSDGDSNGVVDRAEFARIDWASFGSGQLELASLDSDGSETVDKVEWHAYKTSGAAVSDAHVEEGGEEGGSIESSIQNETLADIEALQRTCRTFLRQHDCEKQMREYWPRSRQVRTVLRPLTSDHASLGPLKIEPEPDGSLPQACALYAKVGCNAPQMQFLLRNSDGDLEEWRQQMDDGYFRINQTLDFTRVNANRLSSFAAGTFRRSSIAGNVVALISSLLLTSRLINRFGVCLRNLRSGNAEGKHMTQVQSSGGITAIQIPKLVGMTLMSFYLAYLIITAFVTLLLAVLFGPWLTEVFLNVGVDATRFAGETVIVLVICALGLDMIVGKKILLGGTDDMLHPVLWTWYAVVMLLFNLAKGAALATTRIIAMLFLNCMRVAVLDETSFPAGAEGKDPAFSAFVATVSHANKYRHPIITSLFLRHMTLLKARFDKMDKEERDESVVSQSRFTSWLIEAPRKRSEVEAPAERATGEELQHMRAEVVTQAPRGVTLQPLAILSSGNEDECAGMSGRGQGVTGGRTDSGDSGCVLAPQTSKSGTPRSASDDGYGGADGHGGLEGRGGGSQTMLFSHEFAHAHSVSRLAARAPVTSVDVVEVIVIKRVRTFLSLSLSLLSLSLSLSL